jgi:hypothetical protein
MVNALATDRAKAGDWIVRRELLDRHFGPHIDRERIDLHKLACHRGLGSFGQA